MKTFYTLVSTTLIVFLVSSASAASLYWDPGLTLTVNAGGNGNWDTNDAFWFNGSADIAWTNANGDSAYFEGTGGDVTLTNSIFAGDIYFTNVTGNYTISDLTGAELLTVAAVDTGGTTNTINSPLSGTLTKNGDGTLILTTNNSLTAVTVNQGALQVTTPSALGTGTITVTNNGSLEFNTAAAFTVANPLAISGSGVNGEGALHDVSGQNGTQNGLVTFESTNVVLTGPSGIYDMEGGISTPSGVNANATFSGGTTFRISYNATTEPVNLNAGSITINGGQVNVESTSLTYSNLTVIGGGEFASSLEDASFGSVPSSFKANSITVSNGSYIELSHTFTINANRGVYLGPGGGNFEDLTTSATLSIGGTISGPGTLTVQPGKTGSSVKLTGNNTFTGTCTVTSGSSLNVSGTFGTGNTVNNGTLTIDRGGTLNYAGGISGSGNITLSPPSGTTTLSGPISTTGSLTIENAGTVVLSGANTYSANTLIGCQYFEVNNTSGSGTSSGTVTVGLSTGGTFLGGTGIISGPVTVVAGNTLQPGNVPTNSIGTLTINNTLTLQSGSFTVMNLNAAASTCSAVSGMTSITFGGSLTVTNLNGTLAGGQTYHLFSAGSYSGTFDGGITLPTLPAGLLWNTSNLYVNGTISVEGQNGVLNQPVISGNQLIVNGTQGTAGGTYSVLSTTNLTIPVSSWTVVSTGNPIDSNGNFSFTNTIAPNTPQEFFMIRQP
ncbi:MAG TPA: hypothetical protein VMF08_06245 [Candidatus Sulfotelmatobacter sp.]|nr:hypothetical protein [Candidatus Sulfotelmatobacter sp.]